jgi:hypothetical protein
MQVSQHLAVHSRANKAQVPVLAGLPWPAKHSMLPNEAALCGCRCAQIERVPESVVCGWGQGSLHCRRDGRRGGDEQTPDSGNLAKCSSQAGGGARAAHPWRHRLVPS